MPHEQAVSAVSRAAGRVMSGEAVDAAKEKLGEMGGKVRSAFEHAAGGWADGFCLGGGGTGGGPGWPA
jgi:hypothetical protein